MLKVLIADDEARMRKLVSDFLIKEGYSVLEAIDGQEALDLFYAQPDIDLFILDVMMPKVDGWEVCNEIRATSVVPIVMLTAKSAESDHLHSFQIGADEYIAKPFSPLILIARVNAIARRLHGNKTNLKNYGSLVIDEKAHAVSIDRSKIDLSRKEFDLLRYLAQNEGIALSRDQILSAVWDYEYEGDERTVDTHIKKLRLKLLEKGSYIQTIRGLGYKFEVVE